MDIIIFAVKLVLTHCMLGYKMANLGKVVYIILKNVNFRQYFSKKYTVTGKQTGAPVYVGSDLSSSLFTILHFSTDTSGLGCIKL